ncbi:hypothetical protein Dsin_013558 [Dipteronia sinensis]|uniref:DDE Tnp4 domain-containing protein n=1 Tax=Dipteronia sinensis TaxID=43782 RepID=A0AAE0AKP6_9ROSI|nr:hypothetical protein Dsin_013558 [Dipteronia sinensis]
MVQESNNKINELMRNNSGFGWDPIGKKVTTSDEVWEEYLKFATSENFHKMLKALNTLSKDMMAKPGPVVPAKIRENTKFFPYFKDCIGAIDGTHIPATVMGHDNSSFRDRHGNISQNVLAAYCGFANRRQFLAPYRGVRYHLQDFVGNGNYPENEKELFNLRHASLRNVIERIFGILKSRFTIFKSAPPFPFKTQVEIVLACVALHNFLRKECRSDEFPIEEESASSSSSPIVEEELEELVSQTQEQQREEAIAWRLNIANYM